MDYAILREKKPDGSYTDHQLDKLVCTLGRSKTADIVIADSSVSRLHLRIENRNGNYHMSDNNSSNGTYVNKRKITESVLRDGDDIVAGRVQFYFSYKLDPGTDDLSLMGETVETPRGQLPLDDYMSARTAPENLTDTPPEPQPVPPPTPQASASPPAPPATPQVPPTPPSAAPPPAPSLPPAPPVPPTPPSASAAADQVLQHPPMPAVQGEFQPGSPILRLLAVIIDSFILGVLYIIPFALAFISPTLAIIAYLLVAVAGLAYYIVGWMKFGKTLGKHFLGLRIVELEAPGTIGISLKAVLLRMVGYIICALPLYLLFLMVFFDPDARGLHDKIAGTRVIKTKGRPDPRTTPSDW